ncbi:homeobox protein Hox-A3-like [Rhodamnia argentea]|uniref:Homeobox protein Hox-A3-like n=1 Tax=Rhodamnia argentea TaxID=178133 RepID=A0A8B8NRY6_9MYRT|nr:homeobox protein Hox-A3-like [Rhodamnia argentea]XP_030524929.1 homeobox protein Hox-A3-like [Rhodamnia argentea]XP_048141360.1 homeobox protein Hox-A3-like [Rhodamnia argentea]XP_048141361.1 homeobox protein Hox-A3-like [Rhodamnia argentea]
MATAPVKSQQPLHNFSLAGFLSWGGATSSSSSGHPHPHPHHHRNRRLPPASGDSPPPPPPPDDSDPESRPPRVGSRPSRSPSRHLAPSERLPPPEGEHRNRAAGGGASEDGKAEEAEAARRPWNLRPRRAVNPPPLSLRDGESFRDAAYGAFGGDKEDYAQQQPKSVRLRGFAEEGERKEKRRFWLSLSKEEIEEDIFVMTGSRPARRPRKRPKNEQKQLDIVFPGLWLVGLTADAYRVAEAPAKR